MHTYRFPRLWAEMASLQADAWGVQEAQAHWLGHRGSAPFHVSALNPRATEAEAAGRTAARDDLSRNVDAVLVRRASPFRVEAQAAVPCWALVEPLADSLGLLADLRRAFASVAAAAQLRKPGMVGAGSLPLRGVARSLYSLWRRLQSRTDGFGLVLLRHQSNGQRVIVCNTHLLWDPREPDIKALQAQALCLALRCFAAKHGLALDGDTDARAARHAASLAATLPSLAATSPYLDSPLLSAPALSPAESGSSVGSPELTPPSSAFTRALSAPTSLSGSGSSSAMPSEAPSLAPGASLSAPSLSSIPSMLRRSRSRRRQTSSSQTDDHHHYHDHDHDHDSSSSTTTTTTSASTPSAFEVVPFVVVGDLNSTPPRRLDELHPDFDIATPAEVRASPGGRVASGVLELLTTGSLPRTHQDHPARRGATSVPALVSGIAPLRSAYAVASTTGDSEPLMTTRTPGFAATIDYILVSPSVRVLATLDIPDWLTADFLPNQHASSDHIALVADLLVDVPSPNFV